MFTLLSLASEYAGCPAMMFGKAGLRRVIRPSFVGFVFVPVELAKTRFAFASKNSSLTAVLFMYCFSCSVANEEMYLSYSFALSFHLSRLFLSFALRAFRALHSFARADIRSRGMPSTLNYT